MTRKRIAFLSAPLMWGGIEKQFTYLLRLLDRDRYEPKILVVGGRPGAGWEEAVGRLGDEIHRIDETGRPGRALAVSRAIRRWNASLVHSLHFFLTPYARLATLGRGIPLIGGVRFSPTREYLAAQYGRGILGPFMIWASLNTPDLLVTNSEAAGRILVKTVRKPGRVRVVPNGCEIPDEAEVRRRAEHGRRELRVEPTDLVLGTVGRLDSNKNISLVLRATGQLAGRFPRLKVRIIGDGPAMETLREEAASLGLGTVVSFVGQRPHAEELLPAFDVVCHASDAEGMPNVLMEAAAAGTPVVAADVGGVGEVTIDRDTGFLFRRGDMRALADGLESLLADEALRLRMGAAGRAHVSHRFSVEKMVTSTQGLYAELLAR